MLIRYPGSKSRFASTLLPHLDLSSRHLLEPFAGTAAVGIEALKRGLLDHLWLNDLDPAICALWRTLANPVEHHTLCRHVATYRPDPSDFYDWRDHDGADDTESAFRLIVLHQISYSGLGRRAGSPIGGRDQRGSYKVHVRWSPDRICRDIHALHTLLSHVSLTITNESWETVCADPTARTYSWYLDPPYFAAGPDLYRHGTIDHDRLATTLRTAPSPWLLSYDNDPAVCRLYTWANITRTHETYLGQRGRKQEVTITPPATNVPAT